MLAIFDLQVTLMLPTKFQVNLPFCSGEEVKNRLSQEAHGPQCSPELTVVS